MCIRKRKSAFMCLREKECAYVYKKEKNEKEIK